MNVYLLTIKNEAYKWKGSTFHFQEEGVTIFPLFLLQSATITQNKYQQMHIIALVSWFYQCQCSGYDNILLQIYYFCKILPLG